MSRIDRAIGAVLFVAALVLGTWYVPQVVAAGGKPHFYQDYFGAAVMLACGHGFVNPDDSAVPELRAFLQLQRDDMTCDDRLASVPRAELLPMQRAYRYLMTTVAWTWTLQGRVAWSALAPLYGVFFAASIVLLFAVFRQGMGSWLAGALAVVIAVSPLHIAYLPQLRDYSKMPFVLGIVLLAMRMVLRPMPMRRAITLAAVAGVVTGVGMGYRNDLLVAVPALVAVLLVFTPGDQFPSRWHRLAPPAMFLATFALALSPMWSIYRTGGGSSSQHLLVLGLSESFRQELGLDNGGMYDWTYDYRDELAHAVISGHATRVLGATTSLRAYGPEYDRAGGDYIRRVMENFPADMLTRVYASTIRVLELPYNQKLIPPHDQFLRLPRSVFVVRDRFQRALAPAWLPIVAFALAILAFHEIRLGLFAFALIFYLGAYPAIQFGERHYFHLEFISWWALGFVASLAARGVVDIARGGWKPWIAAMVPADWRRRLAVVSILVVLIGGSLTVPLAALRSYQQAHLRELFGRVAGGSFQSALVSPHPLGDGWVRLPLDPPAGPPGAVVPELVAVEFGGSACDSLKLDARFRYAFSDARLDFTRTLQVQPPLSSAQPLQIFVPAFHYRSDNSDGPAPRDLPNAQYGLVGLDIPESAVGCVLRLGRVADARTLPLLFELRLPPNWQHADLFLTISGWESRRNGDEVPTVYTSPADLTVGRQVLMRSLEAVTPGDIVKRSPTLDTTGVSWSNSGVGGVGGKGPYLYLFETRPAARAAGELALIQGRIDRGGISFGIVKEGSWIEQTHVLARGEFIAVVQVPADDVYSLVLANNLPGSTLTNDLIIRRVGWLRAE